MPEAFLQASSIGEIPHGCQDEVLSVDLDQLRGHLYVENAAGCRPHQGFESVHRAVSKELPDQHDPISAANPQPKFAARLPEECFSGPTHHRLERLIDIDQPAAAEIQDE